MTLKEVSDRTLSLPFLSKYERGLSDISVAKFFHILNKLNVSFQEFECCYYALDKNNQICFINNLQEVFNTDNVFIINKLIEQEESFYRDNHNFRHQHNIIILKQYSNKICNFEYNAAHTTKILQYLLQVEDWGYYEFSLYGNALFFLPLKKTIFLLKTAIKKSKQLNKININKNELCLIIMNIITTLLEKKDITELHTLDTLFNLLENELNSTKYYYEINKYHFLKGIYLLSLGDTKGKELSLKAIEVMAMMGDEDLAQNHQSYLDSALFNLYENK